MNRENYIRLYAAGTAPASAYLLEEGCVYYFSSETDKYSIRGKNLIVGAAEIILSGVAGIESMRLETAIAEKGASIKKIPAERFIETLKSYSFILNASIVLAKQVSLTNAIINRNSAALQGNEKKLKEISIEYYQLVSALKNEYEKRRLPFLKETFTKYENSLLFKRGEAFGRSLDPARASTGNALKERIRDFSRGDIICEEGTAGDEMYVLQSGSIDVIIDGTRVASISDTGTIIGEMALLLGEKRAATLKAGNDVVITSIRKSDLRLVAEKEGNLFLDIAASLAKKYYFNVEKIHTINTMLIERELEGHEGDVQKKMLEMNRAKNEIASLKKDISRLVDTKGADYLSPLL